MGATEELTTGTVAAIGDPSVLVGYRLAGVLVHAAGGAAEAQSAWDTMPDDVALVLVTDIVAEALEQRMQRPGAPLSVVIPR